MASAPFSSSSPYQPSPEDGQYQPGPTGYEFEYSYDSGHPQHAEFSAPEPHAYGRPAGEPQPGPAQPYRGGYQPGRAAAATLVAEPDLIPEPRTAPGSFAEPGSHAGPSAEPAAIPGQRSRADRGQPADGGRPKRPLRPRTGTGPAGKVVRGLVVLSLVGAVTAFVAYDKSIELSVDGKVQQIHTFAGTVGAVLAANSISTGSHDEVSPAPTAGVTDNSTITVRYGRPVQVTVNGVKTSDWVHYPTVAGALSELGVRVTGAVLSVPAAAPIGRQGMTFTVYTQRQVTILVDGKTMHLTTTAPTVAALLQQAGITLHNQDTASVAENSVPLDGTTISVLRITGTTEVKQVSIPYQVTKQSNPNAYSGVTSVVTSGQDGIEQVTMALQTINGVAQPPKQISETVTKQPVTEVLSVGTKPLPSNVADLDWAALAKCESGGRPTAVDSSGTYYGLYQFSVATWDSLGGTGLPSQASAAEQTSLAELLYSRSGVGQWPVCGPNLYK
jgi:resuscitation-promoting factor RpfB